MRQLVRFLLRHEYLIWILCGAILLRLPSLLEPYWYGDEAIYLTIGQGLRSGLELYRDIHDNKPPLLYHLAALSGSVFWFRFLLILWSSLGIILFERLSRMILDENDADGTIRLAGVTFPKPRWSTLATTLVAFHPFFVEGAIANGEVFMIVPVIAGFLLLTRAYRSSRPRIALLVGAGVVFSLGFLLKVPAIFDTIAAGLAFLLGASRKWSSRIRESTIVALAWFAPVFITIVYYSALGVGREYISAAFLQNIGYLSSWSSGTHQSSPLESSQLLLRAMVLLGALIVLFLCRRFIRSRTTLVLLTWFVFAVFGSLLSERPYPHYLIQIIPPLSLLIAHFARLGYRSIFLKRHAFFDCLLIGLAMSLAMFGIYRVQFWQYPLLPYYRNYFNFVLGRQTKDAYFSYFDRSLPELYRLAEQIVARTIPSDRIFVWGDLPMLYALTRRLPPGRYTTAYHVLDFQGEAETIAAIYHYSPRLIVIDREERRILPKLDEILASDYQSVAASGERFSLYRRKE